MHDAVEREIDFHFRLLEAKNAEIFEGKIKSVFVPLCGKTNDMLWWVCIKHDDPLSFVMQSLTKK